MLTGLHSVARALQEVLHNCFSAILLEMQPPPSTFYLFVLIFTTAFLYVLGYSRASRAEQCSACSLEAPRKRAPIFTS
jgi:hypothetical protein